MASHFIRRSQSYLGPKLDSLGEGGIRARTHSDLYRSVIKLLVPDERND